MEVRGVYMIYDIVRDLTYVYVCVHEYGNFLIYTRICGVPHLKRLYRLACRYRAIHLKCFMQCILICTRETVSFAHRICVGISGSAHGREPAVVDSPVDEIQVLGGRLCVYVCARE